MKPEKFTPRILAVVLSACLILPPHAYALRPQQKEAEPQRAGLEEALRSGDSDALIQVASSRLAQWISPAPAAAPALPVEGSSAVSNSSLEDRLLKGGVEKYPNILAGLEEAQVVREALQQILRVEDLVAAQRRAPDYTEDARRLAEEAVKGLLTAATAAGVDLTDRAAVKAFLTPLVSSRAYVAAGGHGSRFSPQRLMLKQLYPADGLVPNMRRALEPVAFTTAPSVAIIDGVVAYHLLAYQPLAVEDRQRILDSLKRHWPMVLQEAGIWSESRQDADLPWREIPPLIEPHLVYAGHPGQQQDLAAAARAFETHLETRFPGVEYEGRRSVLNEGFLHALFQPIIEKTQTLDEVNPYLDLQKVKQLVGPGVILALGPSAGTGGALEAGYQRAEALKLPSTRWDVYVESDQAAAALPTLPNSYLIASLKALASFRQGQEQAALLVVGGKLVDDEKGPGGRGQFRIDPATGWPFIEQWNQLTAEQKIQVEARWQRWIALPQAERTTILRDRPEAAPWVVNAGAYVADHQFARQAMIALLQAPTLWGHPDPKRAFRTEFWQSDILAYRIQQLSAAQPGTPARVEVVLILEKAPSALKDTKTAMAFRKAAREQGLVPAVTPSPRDVTAAIPRNAQIIRLDHAAIASLKNVGNLPPSIIAVLGPDDQPIRRFRALGDFEGDLRNLTRRNNNGPARFRDPPQPVANPPDTALVRHPEAFVPGAARLDQLDKTNREPLLDFVRSELNSMVAQFMQNYPADRTALHGWVEAFLKSPEVLTLTSEQIYQRFFQKLRNRMSHRGISDPWADTKQAHRGPLRNLALKLLDRVQVAKTRSDLEVLFDELALIATQANFIDSQSESARRVFTQPGFFDDFERNVQAAVSKRLAINDLARYHTLAFGEPGRVLYVTDNFEEAYVDVAMAVLLAKLGHTVIMAGKAAPARGDATADDLRSIRDELKGKALGNLRGALDGIKIISSGTDSYGTFLHQATPEFTEALTAARFIVLKGQGNLLTTVTMNALITQAPVVCCLLSKGYTAQRVTGVPKFMNVLVDPAAEIYLVNRTGQPLDVEAAIQDIFAGSDQIEILPGQLYVEPTVRIREGAAFEGTNVLLGTTTVGPGRLLKNVTAENTVFEGHPRLDAFSYLPPVWRTYGRVENQQLQDTVIPWNVEETEPAVTKEIFQRIERRLNEQPMTDLPIVIGITGRLGTGKSAFGLKLQEAIALRFRERLRDRGWFVISLPLEDMLIPRQERGEIRTHADLFEQDMVREVQQALIEGRMVYKHLFDANQRVRLRASAGDVENLLSSGSRIVAEGGRRLLYDERRTQELRMNGKISPVSEVYIDITEGKHQYDLIERFDPRRHIVIHEGTMAAFNEEAAAKYAALVFVTADEVTRRENIKLRVFYGTQYKYSADTLSQILQHSERVDALASDLYQRAEGYATIVMNSSRPPLSPEEVLGIARRKRLALEWNFRNGRIPEAMYQLVARRLQAIAESELIMFTI